MSNLVIPDVADALIERLRERATAHGRSPVVEAKAILEEALQRSPPSGWKQVNMIRDELAETGQIFSDSADLIREDRDR